MKQAHIQLDETVNAQCALLPGDPARLDHIKQYLDNVEELAFNREYRSLVGEYKGMRVIAMSTGMGGVSVAIGIEELKNIGVKTMIRIGSCGALQQGIQLGDLVFAAGAIRDDGTSKTYIDSIYPAAPDARLLINCEEIATENNWRYHTGIVHSHESFYFDENDEIEERWSKKGVLGSDMETAPLFVVGRLRGIRCASILNNVVVYGEDTADSIGDFADGASLTHEGEKREILVALEAMYRLHH